MKKEESPINNPSGSPGSVLKHLLNQIVEDLAITDSRFSNLMEKFVRDPYNNIPNNSKDRNQNRNNLIKEFNAPSISFKVFCKFLRFIRLVKFEIIIKAHHPNKTITVHSKTIDLINIDEKEVDND